jgi:luciferase family oxidoreductase group 1
MKLSVLDQSLARSVDQAQRALQETLAMAQWCESLGFARFWVSEHHAFPAVAGSAPEVLLSALGMVTRRIRLGSGGIMLPHYSAYKVAETFSLLANLYPGRIDLGIGRAPGADMATAVALATDGRPKFERFPELVSQLSNYLRNPDASPRVSPRPPPGLPLWMLGSSADSALLAAERGLPYNLGLFINPQATPDLVRLYRERFRPSAQLDAPYVILATSVFCSDDRERALTLQLTHDLNLFRFVNDTSASVSLTPEQARDYPLGPRERAFLAGRGDTRAAGTPEDVREQLGALAQRYGADEIMAVTNMYYFEERKRSFELLMHSCG